MCNPPGLMVQGTKGLQAQVETSWLRTGKIIILRAQLTLHGCKPLWILTWHGQMVCRFTTTSFTTKESFVSQRGSRNATGHVGVARLLKDLAHRYVLEDMNSAAQQLTSIRRRCKICSACDSPHWQVDGVVQSFPIPGRLMHSVCLDVFSMPPTQWDSEEYDSILPCVDRLSGWITACRTTKLGLTGERAAQLLLHHSWAPFGVPSQVHSDQGTQFVSSWFQTMCSRLDSRLAAPHTGQGPMAGLRGGDSSSCPSSNVCM